MRLLSRTHYRRHLAGHPQCAECGHKFLGGPELERHMVEHRVDPGQDPARASRAAYQNPEVGTVVAINTIGDIYIVAVGA
jgi:hypothetical protein